MPIPESQLETWSHQGAVATSSSTYQTIRSALEEPGAGYSQRTCPIFLQGSYGNDTNIYRESDVDVVMCLKGPFYYDLSLLSPADQAAFHAKNPGVATYELPQFKADVLARLNDKFRGSVTPGNKAVKIAASGNRRSADVLISMEYRRYRPIRGLLDPGYDEGICFRGPGGTLIENYPNQHSANCTAKHQATNSYFKPVARIFKNIRTKLVDDQVIGKGVAPSYYIEGMLYNVPNVCFGGSYQDCLHNCVGWLRQAQVATLTCANGIKPLFGADPNLAWSVENCRDFLDAMDRLWREW